MADRRPLVSVSGELREFPTGDTVPGVVNSRTDGVTEIIAGVKAWSNNHTFNGFAYVNQTSGQANGIMPRSAVEAAIASAVASPARVSGGGNYDREMYGDLVSTGHRDDVAGTQAMSASIRTYMILLGRLPAGEAVTGVRLARTVAPAGTSVTLTGALYGSAIRTATPYTRLGAGNFTVTTAGTGVLSTAVAVTAAAEDRWIALQLVLAGTITTFPTWATSPALPAAVSSLMAQGSGVVVSGYSSAVTAPATTLDVATGWTLNTMKPWAGVY